MHLVEIRVERVHQRDVEPVLPDALRAARLDAVVMPGTVGREHQIARAERHALAVDRRIGAASLHDEAKRGRLVAMGGGEFAGIHHLHAGVEKARGSAPFLAAGVDQHDDAPRRLLGGDQLRRAAHEALDLAPLPQRRHRLRLRIPRLDLVRYGPERAECLAFELAVIRFELGRVLDVRAADDVFALHAGDSTARAVMPNSITPAGAAASAGRSSYAEIAALQLAIRAELGRAAGPDNAPFLQYVMPVGDTRQQPDVLVDEEKRQAIRLQLGNRAVDLLAYERRETFGRFVEDQEARVGHQRAPDRKHLLLAARELVAVVRLPLTELRKEREHALERPPTAAPRGRDQVFAHRQVGEYLSSLGDEAEARLRNPIGG